MIMYSGTFELRNIFCVSEKLINGTETSHMSSIGTEKGPITRGPPSHTQQLYTHSIILQTQKEMSPNLLYITSII